MSASPSPRPGRIALGRWRAGCAGRRPSCARSASRSASSARAGRGPASSTSPPPRAMPRQKTPGRNRPHRPHRPRPCRNPIRPTASRHRPCGRSPMMRTVSGRRRAASDRPRQPVENQRRDRCGRCGRKSPAPICAGKNRGAGLEGAAMSAAEALQAARAAGVRVAIDGDDLVLEASAPPPPPCSTCCRVTRPPLSRCCARATMADWMAASSTSGRHRGAMAGCAKAEAAPSPAASSNG